MKVRQRLVLIFAALILAGAILRIYAYKTGCIMLFMGALYLCLYYLIKTITDIKNKSNNIFTLLFQLILALMSVVIVAKYIYFYFGFSLGLVVIPIFIVCAIIFWIKSRRGNIDLKIVSVIYLFLCIPMFAIFYDKYPLNKFYKYYYPQQYLKYNDIGIRKKFNFRSFWYDNHNQGPNEEVSALALQAHTLAVEEERYEEAIEIYLQIIAMEDPPDAYMYYKLSDCYYRLKQYDLAIPALDSAIILDPLSNAEYYNFRGLICNELNEKELALQDIKKSLELDSTNARTYLNLASVYYYLYGDTQKAYEAMEKVALYDPELADKFSEIMAEWKSKLIQE